MWAKYFDETVKWSADWNDIIGDDTISTVDITVGSGLTVTATVLSTSAGISTIRVSGGAVGEQGYLVATINTNGGQVLRPQQAVKVIDRPTI